ncbi:uncharacterized protein LOC144445667 isoform X2 [Glandiceps talaboti]
MGCTSSTNNNQRRKLMSSTYTSQATETTTLTTTQVNVSPQKQPKEIFTKDDILLIFKTMDRDGNGFLTADEIRDTLVKTKAYESEEQLLIHLALTRGERLRCKQ